MTPQQLADRLRAVAAASAAYPEQRFDGRGIVICAGGARLFTCAWVAIGLLRRHLGCTLPIEVWYLGPDEIGPPMRGLLEELAAEPIDAFEVAKRHQVERLGGWELKPYALMHSRFCEVLLLDADNVPLRDPGFLFDGAEYAESGAVFWPDIVRLAPDNEIWAISGLRYRDMPSFESGQMVLDKSRCWRALSLTHWINQHSDAFYDYLHGDKDTFLIAWLMLSQPFHLIRHRPKLLEATLCQRDPDGGVLFQHRNAAKWVLDGINPRIDGFRLEPECRALLEELRSLWDGRVFNPPPRSDGARQAEEELSRSGRFRLVRISSDERCLALLPDHRIRPGRRHERYWHVADGADGLELRIEGDGVPSCRLQRSSDGAWRGRWLQAPGMPVELIADGSGEPIPRREPEREAGLTPLLLRVLGAGASLPWDSEVARDLVGTLRTLARLDPEVVGRLREEGRQSAPGSARARLIEAALAGLADPSRRPDAGGILPGRGWRDAPFELTRGYRR